MDVRQVFADYAPLSAGLNERFQFCPVCGARLELATISDRPRLRCPACGFIYFQNPGVGVAILIVHGDRFVLCRRTAGSSLRPGQWCLPGGHIEWNEDFLSTSIREVLEETALDVEIEAILSVTSNFFDPQRHGLTVVLLAQLKGGEPGGDNVETDLVDWFSPSEPFPDLAFSADRHIIERYFELPFKWFAGRPTIR